MAKSIWSCEILFEEHVNSLHDRGLICDLFYLEMSFAFWLIQGKHFDKKTEMINE